MILDRIQHYLGIIFFTTLVLTQALIFVAVSASNDDNLLSAVFIEPISENINIGDSIYFQAMISDQADQQYDLVYFNLKNLVTGLDENYQASLATDGTWLAQSSWDTTYAYQPGQYYLSVVAHQNFDDLSANIYYSQNQIINLNGQFEAAATIIDTFLETFVGYVIYPSEGQNINPLETTSLTAEVHISAGFSDVIDTIEFILVGLADNSVSTESFNFIEAATNVGSGDQGVDIWESTIHLADIPYGQYIISVIATDGEVIVPLVFDSTGFTIGIDSASSTSSNEAVLSIEDVPVEELETDPDIIIVESEDVPVEELETNQDTTTAEPVYELSRNNFDNYPVIGDYLELDFTTTLSADRFNFLVLKEGSAEIAVEHFIDPIGDGTSWLSGVSAEENGFTNGTYILTASASLGNDIVANYGPFAFEWQITEDNVSEEEVSLISYQPANGQFGPGDILIASANVLDIQFELFSEQADYILDYTPVYCNYEIILDQEIIDEAGLAGHQYCFYSIISGDITDEILNGNYSFSITYSTTDFSVTSSPVLVTYFNELSLEEVNDVDDSLIDDTLIESPEIITNNETSSDEEVDEEVASEEEITNENIQEEQDDSEASDDSSITEDIVIDYYSTCTEQGISDQETCMWFRATMDLLDQACIEQGIYEDLACEDYLFRMETDLECQENNIIDREECKNYLLEKYGGQVACQLDDNNLCNSILRNKYLNRLVVGQRLSQSINQVVNPLFGQNISTQELSDSLEEWGVSSQDILPLSPSQDIRVLVAKAQKEIILEEADKLTILNQAVIILDTDGDGLVDDLEGYYGTEIDNSDTDGDGYSDGEEIKNGYDPIGPGNLIKARTDFDRVTLDGEMVIEQPKVKSNKIDRVMKVIEADTSEGGLKLGGTAEANAWVNLYLYSGLPLVMTTKTDASGNWSYDIKNSLTDGHHRVFVTVNDDTGKIVKQSRPISFLIKEARAVTADDYFDEDSSSTTVNNLFIYYILGGVFLVFLALGVIIYLHKGKNQNLEM